MSEHLSRRIMDHVSDTRYQPQSVDKLAGELGVGGDDLPAFRRAALELVEAGQVVMGAADTIMLPPIGRMLIGTFRKNERGFGFIVPDPDRRTGHGDLFVPPQNTGDAMTGDRVRAKIIHAPGRGSAERSPYIGRIVEIIQRADRHYVGTLFERGGRHFVQVDGKLMHDPVLIRDPHARDAQVDDKVVIELVRYPEGEELAEGVITEVLGEKGLPEV
jgi:ribonuclease R